MQPQLKINLNNLIEIIIELEENKFLFNLEFRIYLYSFFIYINLLLFYGLTFKNYM